MPALSNHAVTRSALIERVYARLSAAGHNQAIPQKDVELGVKVLLDAVGAAVARGGRVEVRGFGSFVLNARPPRIGRNPKTGEPVLVSAKRVPHFRPGKELRQLLLTAVAVRKPSP